MNNLPDSLLCGRARGQYVEDHHSPVSVSCSREEAVESAKRKHFFVGYLLELELGVLGGEAATVNAYGSIQEVLSVINAMLSE